MKPEDHNRVFQVGCSVDRVAVTTKNDEEAQYRYLYTFTPEQLDRYTRETENHAIEKSAMCIEASGSRSRSWLAELLRNLKSAK